MPNTATICLKKGCREAVVLSGIECTICERWAHPDCSGQTAKAFELYKENADLAWTCQPCCLCFRGVLQSQREERRLKRKHRKRNPGHISQLSNPDESEGNSTEDEFTDCESVAPPVTSETPMIPVVGAPNPIDTRLSAIESRLELLSGQLQETVAVTKAAKVKIQGDVSRLHSSVESITFRQRNALLLDIPEVKGSTQKMRRSREVAFVRSVFRAAQLPPDTKWIRVHRVGKWTEDRLVAPRPVLVEFTERSAREMLLARKNSAAGITRVVPDSPKWLRPAAPEALIGRSSQPVVRLERLELGGAKGEAKHLGSLNTSSCVATPSMTATPRSAGVGHLSYSQVVATMSSPTASKAVQTAQPRRKPPPPKKGLVPRLTQTRDD